LETDGCCFDCTNLGTFSLLCSTDVDRSRNGEFCIMHRNQEANPYDARKLHKPSLSCLPLRFSIHHTNMPYSWVGAIQRRVGIASTVLRSMKPIKLCGLVDSMKQLMQEERVRELKLGLTFRWTALWVNVVANVPSSLSSLIVFATYAIQAQINHTEPLTTAKAFSTVSLLMLVANPGAALLQAIPVMIAGMGCARRVHEFLVADSFDDGRNSSNGQNSDDEKQGAIGPDDIRHSDEFGTVKVVVSGLQLGPEDKTVNLNQDGISFEAGRGSLTTILGPVGSGKSTFLRAMLGEVKPTRGTIMISSTFVGYCSQAPWLPNLEIREAIVGANEFDQDWYSKVIHVCALEDDFNSMPQNDLTIMGSRGVVLSGGQKHRVVSTLYRNLLLDRY
jgi:ATP-binding cassette subfamily C (CFTR/MRP) protein 1